MINNDEQLNITSEEQEAAFIAVEQAEGVNTVDISAEQAEKERKRKRIDRILNIAIWIAIAVLIVMIVLRVFVFTNIEIVHESMLDTYKNGEVVLVNKAASAKRGDVVIFYTHDVDNKLKAMFATGEDAQEGGKYEKYIKRVVAVAGDKMWVESTGEGDLFRVVIETADGTRLHEDYYKRRKTEISERLICNSHSAASTLLGTYLENTTEDNPLVISEGHFFVMGDNRNNSVDSRTFGEVPVSRLFGVVLN